MNYNYKLTLEYNGSLYSGSQAQNGNPENLNQRTVQAELEKGLSDFFQTIIKTNFAGRTDAGVHAIGQVVNFKLDRKISELEENNPGKILIGINSKLPEDLSASKIEMIADDFHARFSAKSREYMYKIFVRRSRPVLRLDSLAWVKEPLDFNKMQEAAKKFLGTHDFSAYAKDDDDPDANYLCTIEESELVIESAICVKYRVKANRFLRHMVRRMVGELVQIGKGDSDQNSSLTMPAHGLTLMKVYY